MGKQQKLDLLFYVCIFRLYVENYILYKFLPLTQTRLTEEDQDVFPFAFPAESLPINCGDI